MKTTHCILALVLAGLAGIASATTIYVDAAATGAGDGTSWAHAYTTIQAAVAASAAGDSIRVASGDYVLAAEIAVNKAVMILAENGPATTFVNGGGTTRCFNMTAAGVIDGFTITNGVTTTGGGGVKMTAGIVRNCVLIKNSAGTTAAAGGGGGGVWMSGGLVYDCDIIGNTGRIGNDDGGGGARLSGGTISNCYVYANANVSAGCGGGIALMHSTALAVDCTVVGNAAYNAGGGVWAYPGRVYRCVMTGNRVTNNGNGGGGGGLRDGGIVDSCIVTNNTGLGVYYRNGTVRNSLIANNSGAGVYTTQTGGQINNCTLANNGGVGVQLDGGGTTVRNTILHGNSAIYGGGNLATTLWYNNITPTAIPGGAVLNGNIVGDPLFLSPSTGDYRVPKTSPAIDAGMNLASSGVTTDLDGVARPTRYAYDIGCYEEAQAVGLVNLAPLASSSEAVLGGKLLHDGGLPTRGTIYWGTSDGGTDKGAWQHAIVFDPVTSGQMFMSTVTVASASTYYFRTVASNAYDEIWVVASQQFTTYSGTVQDRLWTGGGADALASNPANWLDGVAPQAGDGVVLDTASSKNMTWDAAAPSLLARWVQSPAYSGTVTIETRYPDQGGFTNLTVTGSCGVEGGVWTHPGPQTAQIYNLGLSVGGDFTLGPQASINLDSKGWKDSNGNTKVGPGGGSANYHANYDFGAAHGGMGGDRNWKSDYTYGSVFRPEHLGSGAGRSYGGGGALRLVCGGRVTVNGEIRARGGSYDGYGGSSGGSIFIQATELFGTNRLCVSAQAGSDAGAGGRIAVVLTSGTSFGSVVMEAFGGKGSMAGAYASSRTREGAAGTIYLQKAGQSANQGTLILDNGGLPNFFPAVTTIPASKMGETTINFAAFEAIVVRGGAVLFARPDVSLDFATANINPDGHADGWVAVMQTNNLVFPAGTFSLDTFNLVFGTNWFYPGDFTVGEQAVVSHFGSTGSTQDYGLDLAIGGDLTVAAGAMIDVSYKGFLQELGPGKASGLSSSPYGFGASHGGRGSRTDYHLAEKTYGSFLAPTTFGSGGAGQWNHAGYFGFFRGGGAAKLTVAGATQLDGEILALGGSNNDWSTPASGGSVWLTTGSLQGGGRIDVRGGVNARPGGGGRIAVHLTDSTSFGAVVLDASGRTGSAGASAAGTVYRQWPGLNGPPVGELRIDNAGLAATVLTPVPADLEAPLLTAPWREAGHVALVVTNRAQAAMTLDARFRDLFIRNTPDPTRLHLQGHRLQLDSYPHADWGDEAWVVYNGGEILWRGGTLLTIR